MDCELLLARGTVHWEWFYGWQQTMDHYYPNYPTDIVWEDFYKSLDEKIFIFKPREWRGTNVDGAPPFSGSNYLTEEEMAAEINGYPPGTVSHLYLTSDGGMNLPTIYTMLDM